MKSLRIGIVGIGNMGSAHAVCISQGEIEGLLLTAVCDIAPKRRKWARTAFPAGSVAIFTDYKEMLQSGLIDAVLIATPHRLHADMACQAFSAGLHVLTEKPAGISVSQAEAMIQAARASGKAFGIMFNQRTNELFAKARALVREGALGQPKRLVWIITNWYRTQGYYDSGSWRATWAGEGGGVLLNQAPHNLDLWQWIFGMPQRLYATCTVGKYHNIEVEDDAALMAEYENGATAMFLATTGELPGTNRLEISGDRGKIVIENDKLTFWQLSGAEREYCYAPDGTPAPSMTRTEFQPRGVETAHKGILQNFTDHILKGTPLLAEGSDGSYSLTLSNAAYLSAWTDKWVSLPLSEQDQAEFERLLKERCKASSFVEDCTRLDCAQQVSDESSEDGTYREKWNVNW